jgi:hypothetical protein
MMTRPHLHEIPLAEVRIGPKSRIVLMSTGQWDPMLEALYAEGWVLMELDGNDLPVRAYRRCDCELCNPYAKN